MTPKSKSIQNQLITFYCIHSRLAVVVATAATVKQSEKKQDIGKEAAIEAEVRAARERALVPLETRVSSFKEMLKEKDVSIHISLITSEQNE